MQLTPHLVLVMKDAAYFSSPPHNGGGGLLLALHHVQQDEKYDTCSIATKRGGVGGALLLFSL